LDDELTAGNEQEAFILQSKPGVPWTMMIAENLIRKYSARSTRFNFFGKNPHTNIAPGLAQRPTIDPSTVFFNNYRFSKQT